MNDNLDIDSIESRFNTSSDLKEVTVDDTQLNAQFEHSLEDLKFRLDLNKSLMENPVLSHAETLELLDEYFLEHGMELVYLDGSEWVSPTDALQYGRLGMKWGVRHKRGSDGKVTTTKLSEDAREALEIKAKLNKAGGTHVLTNVEIEKLKKRIDLEKQYAKTTGQDRSRMDKRHDKAKKLVDYGKTANDLIKFYNSPAGKLLRDLVGLPVEDDDDRGDKKDKSDDKKDSDSTNKSKKSSRVGLPNPAARRLLVDATRLGRPKKRGPKPNFYPKRGGNPRPKNDGKVHVITDLR